MKSCWTTSLSITSGDHALQPRPFGEWINEGLLTIFFFVVGLEIKRELVNGQLASRRARCFPLVAADRRHGGAGTDLPRHRRRQRHHAGGRSSVATDIPLALGVLAIAGRRVRPRCESSCSRSRSSTTSARS